MIFLVDLIAVMKGLVLFFLGRHESFGYSYSFSLAVVWEIITVMQPHFCTWFYVIVVSPKVTKSEKQVTKKEQKREKGYQKVSTAFCWTKFPKKVAKVETKFLKFSPKFALKFAPKFAPKFFVLSWQVEKSSPKISPDFSHRKFQISNRIPNQISPINSQTHICRLGSSNQKVTEKEREWPTPFCLPPLRHVDSATNYVFGGSTRIPRKTHENWPRVRTCLLIQWLGATKKSAKSPRKFHEDASSLARPWTVARDPEFSGMLAIKGLTRDAKITTHKTRALYDLLSKLLRNQSNQWSALFSHASLLCVLHQTHLP